MATEVHFQRFDFLDNLELMRAQDYRNDFPPHFHDLLCITLAQEGVECTEVKGEKILSPRGHISLTYPQEVHANPNINQGSYSFVTYYVSPDLIPHYDAQNSPDYSERILRDPWLFEELYGWAFASSERQCLSRIKQVLDYLFQSYVNIQPISTVKEPKISNLPEILHFLDAHLGQKISLEALAKMAGLSKYYFIRAFKKAKGITPANYLTLRRIEAAKKILISGNSIVDACYQVGFYDQSHFSRYFKKYNGITPQQFQRGSNILQDPVGGQIYL